MSLFQRIFQQMLKRFTANMGRGPVSPFEWNEIQSATVRHLNKTKGVPKGRTEDPFSGWKPEIVEQEVKIDDLLKGPVNVGGPKGPRTWDFSKKAEIIDFPKKGIPGLLEKGKEKSFMEEMIDRGHKAIKPGTREYDEYMKKTRWHKKSIDDLIKSGDVQVGKAPKTQKSTLDAKKGVLDKQISKEMRIKEIQRENKEAIERFRKRMEEPDKFQYGGIAPLVGEPTYAANFYDDRVPMAGGGALFKFIERLFIKASNDIRQGKGKWQNLKMDQRIAQHDNLTKKLIEWEKTGNTEGLEQYFDVNVEEAFGAAKAKVKKPKVKDEYYSKKDMEKEWDYENDLLKKEVQQEDQMIDTALSGMDERQLLKQKYPGISDDLLNKILIDDNPQRKADVMATMDQYLKLREVGKGENEAYSIITESIKDTTKHAEGGRAGYIFGGSAGLRGLWRNILKNVSKGKDKPVKKFFPKPSVEEKEILDMGKKYLPSDYKNWSADELALKVEGIDNIINRLKNDKKILERQASNKALKDEGLDFLMKEVEKSSPEIYGHLGKYTDIDKDILQMETIKKNILMKDRKLNAAGGRIGYQEGGGYKAGELKHAGLSNSRLQELAIEFPDLAEEVERILAERGDDYAYGGRIGYAGGGKAGLPAITQGLPQGPNMQQPQMPAGPQPVGMPGGDLLVQNQMQQNPWMGQNPNMKQGIGGMPRAQMAGGGMGRRAFMKLLAAMSAAPFVGKGVQKAAPKMIKESAEVISKDIYGQPDYINDLIAVVKAKGTRESVPGMKQSDLGTKHTYKGVEVTEDAGGNIRIKKEIEGGGQYTDEFGEIDTWDGTVRELDIEIHKGGSSIKDEGLETQKMVPEPDAYFEGTVTPDMDGKMKDVVEYIDDVDHLDLKKIADEINEEVIIKKASGGLAAMLGE